MSMRTICNPINISYCYQKDYCSRESADPAIVVYKDEYYLFASHGEGYWVSKDLAEWEFIQVDLEKQPQFELFAPAVCVIGDRLYLAHSQGGTVMYSETPRDPDSWVDLGRPIWWDDPCFLYDDDGYVYVYYGITRDDPIKVVKLDPNDDMRLVEGPYPVCSSDIKNRGAERRGHHNEIDDNPYFEGPWMNKYNGKYYLQCALPGTEWDTYADCCFVGDTPLGPFTYCDNSPVCFKATGFLRGCGHGCLFQDLKGHWWKVQTNAISIHHIFERRISLYPCEISEDGKLYANTLRSDYPMLVPHDNPDPFHSSGVDWHLLSYGKKMTASSILDEAHAPAYAADEHMATWWCAKTSAAGEWLAMDFEKACTITAIQINFADQGVSADTYGRKNVHYGYQYILEGSLDGETWSTLLDRSSNTKDMPHDYVQLDTPLSIRHLKITNCGEVPAGSLFAISGLRVFGPASGPAPVKAPAFTVTRLEDARDMEVFITPVEDAEGYYIRFGVTPDTLYTHYQVLNDQLHDHPVHIGCLNRHTAYYITVDAYNASGITKGTSIQVL